MLFAQGVLISLPAREMARVEAPSSLFDEGALTRAPLSPALQRALACVTSAPPPAAPRLIVVRPEMFTHGAALAWLKARTGDIEDHICLSDGSAVRLLPGFRNHVYFFDLGALAHAEALARLERRAPEALAQFQSQINGALRFRGEDRPFAPETLAVVADRAAPSQTPELRRLVVNRHSCEDSVARTLQRPPLTALDEPFDRMVYLRISERGLADPRLARRLLACVADTHADPRGVLVWRLPDLPGAAPEARVAAAMGCLFAGGGGLPGSALRNVYCAMGDFDPQALDAAPARRTLIADDFADFTGPASGFYPRFDQITIFARAGRHMADPFEDLMKAVYGPQARVEWLLAEAPGGDVRAERNP